jgi:hypothetical protein
VASYRNMSGVLYVCYIIPGYSVQFGNTCDYNKYVHGVDNFKNTQSFFLNFNEIIAKKSRVKLLITLTHSANKHGCK